MVYNDCMTTYYLTSRPKMSWALSMGLLAVMAAYPGQKVYKSTGKYAAAKEQRAIAKRRKKAK